ncbi:MAG: PAS domain S-box protein, partial [Rhodocyclaceae bacterium]
MPAPTGNRTVNSWASVARIVLPYLAFGILWIFFSDHLVERLTTDPETQQQLQTLKGWFFIALTGALLAFLLHRLLAELHAEQRKLAENEARQRALLKSLPDLVWMKTPDGRYLECNALAASLFGRPPAAIIGHSDHELLPVEAADELRANDLAAIEAGGPRSNDEWLTFKSDGERKRVQVTKTPVFDTNGALLGVLGVGREITALHNEQERTREALERAAAAFHSSPAAISLTRVIDGTYVEVNETYSRLFGWSNDELRGRDPLVLGIWPEEAARQDFRRTVEEKGTVSDYETTLVDRQGYPHFVNITGKSINIGGEPHLLGFIIDRTEAKNNEASVKRLQNRFTTAFQSAPVAACITRMRDGLLVEVNERLASEYEWPRHELLGKTTLEVGVWGSAEDRAQMVSIIRERGSISDYVSTGVSRSGKRYDISLSASVIELDNEPHLLSYVVNITDRQRALEALAAREEVFHV